MALASTQLLTEIFLEDKGRPAHKADNLTTITRNLPACSILPHPTTLPTGENAKKSINECRKSRKDVLKYCHLNFYSI
jgi:hypothetical protein